MNEAIEQQKIRTGDDIIFICENERKKKIEKQISFFSSFSMKWKKGQTKWVETIDIVEPKEKIYIKKKRKRIKKKIANCEQIKY